MGAGCRRSRGSDRWDAACWSAKSRLARPGNGTPHLEWIDSADAGDVNRRPERCDYGIRAIARRLSQSPTDLEASRKRTSLRTGSGSDGIGSSGSSSRPRALSRDLSAVLHHPWPLATVDLKLPRTRRLARLLVWLRRLVVPVRVRANVGRVLALLVSGMGDARRARHEAGARRAEHPRRDAGAARAIGALGRAVHRANLFEQPVLLTLVFVDRHRSFLAGQGEGKRVPRCAIGGE